MTGLGAINELSRAIDATYPPGTDREAVLWRRCAKVAEESGEVIEAVLGYVGENPRKGQTHTLEALQNELLDVAVAALGALAHTEPDIDLLAELEAYSSRILRRLRAAIESGPGCPGGDA